MTDLVPPQALEAEESLLGAMMLSPHAVDAAADILDGTEFYRPSHATIYRAALHLHNQGVHVDVITLADRLEQSGELDAVGGRVNLHQIASTVPATSQAARYARIVADCATDRALIAAAQEIGRLGWDRPGDTTERVDQAEQIIYELGNKRTSSVDLTSGVTEYMATLQRLRDNPNEMVGLPSGYHALDEITQGFSSGNLIIVGARPSMGKSALALCITSKLIQRDIPVGIWSLEMSKTEVDQRLLSLGASVAGDKLRDPRKMTEDEWLRARDYGTDLNERPFFISDQGSLTPQTFRAQVRRLKARVPNLGLVFVDYLQLMTTGGRHSGDNRVQEVSEISRALKTTARDLDVPIVALSQLSRAVEQRIDKRPMLSDLRESGSIEQDADLVLFLFRESYYTGDDPPQGWLDRVEVNVAKHRNGPTGRFELGFKRDEARFTEIPRAHLMDVAV